MIASLSNQRPPYILSASIYQSPSYEPEVGRFLLQGTATGAVIYFLIQLTLILSAPRDTDKFVFVIFLPFVLGWGMLVGITLLLPDRLGASS